MLRVLNISKSTIVADDIKEAKTFLPRLKGLIGRTSLNKGEGLWMAGCRAIHTIGMRFPIDLVFTDKDLVVKKVVKEVRPFCPIVCCFNADGVFELPVGSIERAQIQSGDKIEILHTFE